MGRTILCLFAVLIATAAAQNDSAPAQGPIAFAPTRSTEASAPSPMTSRVRSGTYASDSLATTPTSLSQIQTIGSFSSAHSAPVTAIQDYLATDAAQAAFPAAAYVPKSTQYEHTQIFDQLETYGVRQLHFPIYYDPNGTLYQQSAGLKIANLSSNLTAENEKWSYPGWKIMNEPNFDFNTSCVGLTTCLFNIKNWLLSTPATVPLVIYLEPTNYTYTSDNTTFADALAASNQTEGPDALAQPLDVTARRYNNQPWRDLENEILKAFDDNSYDIIVTPDDLMDDDKNLSSSIIKNGYTVYPPLDALRSRMFFVLTGNTTQNYLQYYPDLVNATMFVAEPYKDNGKYGNSTLFVDVVGPLDGANYTNFNATAADTAADKQAAWVTKAAKAGYLVRASADWNTLEARNNYTGRANKMLAAGAHFVQTSFPTVPTLFPTSGPQGGYRVALPFRGNVQQSTRCNPVTTGQLGVVNTTALYTLGCPKADALTPGMAPALSPTSASA